VKEEEKETVEYEEGENDNAGEGKEGRAVVVVGR
jgi:hypothetical protein